MKIRPLNKKDLCVIFGLTSHSSGRAYYPELKKRYFTREALEKIGMSDEEYNSIRCGKFFSFDQSKRIIEHFNILAEDLESIHI